MNTKIIGNDSANIKLAFNINGFKLQTYIAEVWKILISTYR